MNDNISEKFLANDKILESLAMQLDGFDSVIKNQLSFNELVETKVTQLASSCHNTGGATRATGSEPERKCECSNCAGKTIRTEATSNCAGKTIRTEAISSAGCK